MKNVKMIDRDTVKVNHILYSVQLYIYNLLYNRMSNCDLVTSVDMKD